MRPARLLDVILAALCALTLSLSATAAQPDRGPAWTSLNTQQKQALEPLRRDWASIDAPRREKWLEVATRFPSMSADERARVSERMAEWARLKPAERAQARLQFQETRQLPADERQARWLAYQALSPEQRKALAQRAKPANKPPATATAAAKPAAQADPIPGKRNVVQAPSVPRGRTVAPTVVQAQPGATTRSMAMQALPPLHHQTSLPKIAATTGFVDAATLLPKRGPQGAAVRPVAVTTPTTTTP